MFSSTSLTLLVWSREWLLTCETSMIFPKGSFLEQMKEESHEGMGTENGAGGGFPFLLVPSVI